MPFTEVKIVLFDPGHVACKIGGEDDDVDVVETPVVILLPVEVDEPEPVNVVELDATILAPQMPAFETGAITIDLR